MHCHHFKDKFNTCVFSDIVLVLENPVLCFQVQNNN